MYMFWMIPWWFGEAPGVFHVTAYKLIDGDIAAAVVLISFGALLGRTNPAQLLVMCFFELMVWAVNFYICVEYLGIIDVGGSIVVHCFGAYFGLAASFIIGKPLRDDENKSMYHSDMFAMIGTLFLWLYWPSFNGFFASREYYFMDRAFVRAPLMNLGRRCKPRHLLMDEKTLRPCSSLCNETQTQVVYPRLASERSLRVNSASSYQSRNLVAEADLDVELRCPLRAALKGLGLFDPLTLHDLSLDRRKSDWVLSLGSNLKISTKGIFFFFLKK